MLSRNQVDDGVNDRTAAIAKEWVNFIEDRRQGNTAYSDVDGNSRCEYFRFNEALHLRPGSFVTFRL